MVFPFCFPSQNSVTPHYMPEMVYLEKRQFLPVIIIGWGFLKQSFTVSDKESEEEGGKYIFSYPVQC